MKTRRIMFDYDLGYGRDIRIAGILALMLVTVAFLFMPQPKVEPHRLHGQGDWILTIESPVPAIYDPPKPAGLVPRSVPAASDNPEAPTIDPNTGFNELRPDVTATTIEAKIPFWKVESKPKLVHEVVPDYPEMARTAGIEGKVIVAMVVDALGNVAARRSTRPQVTYCSTGRQSTLGTSAASSPGTSAIGGWLYAT
jgi:hypothetical protein